MSDNTSKALTMPVVSRSVLRRGQASLYDLIVQKIDTNEPITYDEAERIWLDKVCRNMVNNIPHTYVWIYKDGVERPTNMPMSDEEIAFNVMNWLTRNIGILVMKGYLKAVPMIKLEQP